MNEFPINAKKAKLISLIEILIIIVFSCIPLFGTFPYRVNIFLSWEGAYRLSQGQIPYKDFGMPLGYMYWVIPALFFKLFGAQMITLIKAQAFINILSGLAFRSILKSISIQPGIRMLSVLLYVLSFSFFNFWPWYNHTVIVYEMIALAFLMKFIFSDKGHWMLLSASALFVFFSFFTKQDGGGLALILCLCLLSYNCFYKKQWIPLVVFLSSLTTVALAIIAPLTKFNFGYWFNHGQPPHTARLSLGEIFDEFFLSSQWIKFYLLLILLLCLVSYRNWKDLIEKKRQTTFLLLTLGILAEATVIQVTSYTPPDNNIFFHSFAFAFILSLFASNFKLNFYRPGLLAAVSFCMLLWWSGTFWKYFQRIIDRVFPSTEITVNKTGENIVNHKTFMINTDTTNIPMSKWVFTNLKSFNKIYMPKPTVEGIQRLLNMDLVKNNKNLKVLNMTELTPLALAMPYKEEKGPDVPLWYHLGVAMFNRQAEIYEHRIIKKQYDLVLFEYIPTLNNFYPFRVRDSLLVYYQKIDSFNAPRRGDTRGWIEIYIK